MKASELVKRLTEEMALHGDLEVVTEGCDCDGDACTVEVKPAHPKMPEKYPAYFYVRRSP